MPKVKTKAPPPPRTEAYQHPKVQLYVNERDAFKVLEDIRKKFPILSSFFEVLPPMNMAKMKELLGWQEETEKVKFGGDFTLVDEYDKKVRCTNNVRNRYITNSWLETLIQEHLHGQWKFNGETIIIGKTGIDLSGQHRLISGVRACQKWEKNKAPYEEVWKEMPTMETVVIYGISEDDKTVNTLDSGKPRSVTEVFYRSEHFQKFEPGKRKAIARLADFAIRLLWNRTGAKGLMRRTHSETMDFLDRHLRVLRCVKHIHEECKEKTLSFIQPGTSAGVLYLMGAAESDVDEYIATTPRSEKTVNWDSWDKACDFWTMLYKGDATMHEVRIAIAGLTDPETGVGGSNKEKMAILAKAWKQFKDGNEITKEDLDLSEHYHDTEGGVRKFMDPPDFGGIDHGDPKEEVEDDAEGETIVAQEDEPGLSADEDEEPEVVEAPPKRSRKQHMENIIANREGKPAEAGKKNGKKKK